MKQDVDFFIYTDVDSLLDTRFVTYGMLAFDKLNELQINGFEGLPYFNRLLEKTDLCDMDEWRELYQNRDKSFLAATQPTSVLPLIIDTLEDAVAIHNRPVQPEYGGIIINTFPYKLTEEEEQVLISDLLNYSPIPEFSMIKTINMDIYGINQKFVKDNRIRMIISYGGNEIMASLSEHHSLATNPMPNLTLSPPAISMAEKANLKSLFQGDTYGLGPFGLMELSVEISIDLKFLDGSVFNGILTRISAPEK